MGRGLPGMHSDMYVVNSSVSSTNSRARRSPICEKIQQIAAQFPQLSIAVMGAFILEGGNHDDDPKEGEDIPEDNLRS